MKPMHTVWGVAKADFLERVRRFSFVAFCALAVCFTVWFVPRPTGFTALVIEPDVFRQGSDPSWVPMSAAMCGGMVLCLFGFVYILSAVRHDRESGVLTLLRVSPTGRAAYLFGKLLADTLLLLCLLAAVMAGAFLMMELRFPGRLLPPWDFFSPFLCVAPGLAFVSAFALLMECAPLFRRQSGFAIALFFCLSVAVLTFASIGINPFRMVSVFDFSGYLWMRDSISAAARAVTGQPVTHISLFTDSHIGGAHLTSLSFHGLIPSAAYLADKLALLGAAILLTLLAACLLPRTDKSPAADRHAVSPHAKAAAPSGSPRYGFGLFTGELHKLLGPQPLYWRVGAAGLWTACLFAPMGSVRGVLFMLIFAWLMPVFSPMGCTERRSGMADILRTVPGAMGRQAAACWLAGTAIALTSALPVLVRLLCLADMAGFLSALAFALLIPAAALFVGEVTGSGRPFEILLLLCAFLALNVPSLAIAAHLTAASGTRITAALVLSAALPLLTVGKRRAK